MSGPGVAALVAVELEVTLLQALDDKELRPIPAVFVFDEELGEGLLTRPLNTNPLERLLLSVLVHVNLVLNRELAVDVVLDLLN